MKRGGADPTETGVDQPIPENQRVWPPEGVFVSRTPLDTSVIDPLRDVVVGVLPGVEVRLSQDRTRVGFWETRSPDDEGARARDRALDRIDLQPTFQFVLSITPSLFGAMTDHYWKILPKQEYSDGSTIYLEKFDAALDTGQMRFHVHGWVGGHDIVGIPIEPGFDFTQTATLFAVNERIESLVLSGIDVDDGIEALTKILLGHVPFVGPELLLLGGVPTPGGFPNLARAFLGRLPTQVLVPGTQLKMLLQYESIKVSSDKGILIEISDKLTTRTPRLMLTASHPTVPAPEVAHATAEVHFTTHDFRDPHVEWRADGSIERIGHGARITFTLPPNRPATMTFPVHATATDEDGGRDPAKVDVQISTTRDPSETPHGHVPEPRRGRD